MKNLKELEKKYEELGEEIAKLKREKEAPECVGDPIFLLSTGEYKKYKDKIPHINCMWWLQSRGYYSSTAVVVSNNGTVNYDGWCVHSLNFGVRPVLRINRGQLGLADKNDKIFCCGMTWIKIDDNLYIAEVPISFKRFDEHDNDYAISEIRQFLLDWYEERANW